MDGIDSDVIRGIERVTGETFNAETGQWTTAAQIASAPHLAGAGTFTTVDDGYDLLVARIRRGTTINGAIVALCPAEDKDGNVIVTADVCIDGPPVP